MHPGERVGARVRRWLRRAELPVDTVELAQFLLGAWLVAQERNDRAVVRIVETEAYVPGDAASHAFRGETVRNQSMFLRRGHAYVYFIYGTSYCLNVTSETPGVGAAVLIRAGEPLGGLARMRSRRNCADDRMLCRGPGRLAAALGIAKSDDGLDLCASGRLRLAAGAASPASGCSERIGLTKERSRRLRFFEVGSPFVSGPRTLNR